MAVGPFEVVGAAETLALAVLAFILLWRGGRRPATLALGLHLVAFATILLALTGPALLDLALTPLAQLSVALARVLLWSSLLAFAVLFPSWTLTPRKALLLAASILPGFLIVWTTFVNPGLMLTPAGAPSSVLRDVVLALRDGALFVSLVVFGRHFLRAERGPYRAQFLYVLLPYLLYAVNDGAAEVSGLVTGGPPPHVVLLAFTTLSLAAAGWIVASSILRIGQEGKEGWEHRVVLGWTLAAIPLAFVQFGTGALAEEGLFLHFVVDGLAAFVLFYAVARHHILDIDLKLKVGIRRGVVASIGLITVLVVEALLQEWIGRAYGLLAGALVAALGLVVLTPIHRMAERLSEKAFPHAGGGGSYLEYKRLELYRVAVEGLVHDGVDVSRAAALAGLRRKLRISDSEHEAIASEVRAELVAVEPT